MASNFVVTCDHCDSAAADLFCHADAVFLCRACDETVHANRIASRHVRVPAQQCPVWAYREVKLRGRVRELGPDAGSARLLSCNKELDIFADSGLWAQAPGSNNAELSSMNTAQNIINQPRSLQGGSFDFCGSIPSEGSLLASTMHANLNLHDMQGVLPVPGSPVQTHMSMSAMDAVNGGMSSGTALLGSSSYMVPQSRASATTGTVSQQQHLPADAFDLPISAAAMLGDMGASAAFGSLKSSNTQLLSEAEGAGHNMPGPHCGLHHPQAQHPMMQQQQPTAQLTAALRNMQQQLMGGRSMPGIAGSMPGFNCSASAQAAMQAGLPCGSSQPIPMSSYSVPARASSTALTMAMPGMSGIPGLGQDWVMSDPGCHLGARLSSAVSEDDIPMPNPQSLQLQGSLSHSLNAYGCNSPCSSKPNHQASLAASLVGCDEAAPSMQHRLAMSTQSLPATSALAAAATAQRASYPGIPATPQTAAPPVFPGMQQALLAQAMQQQVGSAPAQPGSLQDFFLKQQQALLRQQLAMAAGANIQAPMQLPTPAVAIAPAAKAAANQQQQFKTGSLPTDMLLAALTAAPSAPPPPTSHRLGASIHIEATPASVIEAKARALIESTSRTGGQSERVDPSNLMTRLELPDGTVKHLSHERALQLHRYRTKRMARLKAYAEGQRKIRYECRRTLAEGRPRVKGRFAKVHSSDNLLGLGSSRSVSLERALSLDKSAYSQFMQSSRIDEDQELGAKGSMQQPKQHKISSSGGGVASSVAPSPSRGNGPGRATLQQLQLLLRLQAQGNAQAAQQQQQALRRALSCSEFPRSLDTLLGGLQAPAAAVSSAAASPTPSIPSLSRLQAGSQSTDMYSSAPGAGPSALASAMAAACRHRSAVITDQELAALGMAPGALHAKSPGDHSEQSAESMSTHEPSANMAKALGMHSCLHASHTGLAHQQDQPMHGLEPASGQGESMQGCMGLQADGMDMHCDLDLPDVGRSSSPFANGDLFADQQVSNMLDALLQDQYDL